MICGGADVIKIEIKCTVNVMHLNHPELFPPPPQSMEKLSSMKPAPGAKKVGDCCSRVLALVMNFWVGLRPRSQCLGCIWAWLTPCPGGSSVCRGFAEYFHRYHLISGKVIFLVFSILEKEKLLLISWSTDFSNVLKTVLRTAVWVSWGSLACFSGSLFL